MYGVDAAIQPIVQRHPFWGLAQTFAPSAGYGASIGWIESYAKPWAKLNQDLGAGFSAYGGLSIIASGTVGEDVFKQRDTGRVSLEDGFLGVRGKSSGHWSVDLSAGAQPYRLGQGLVLAVGAGNGFERGALTLAPRRAWEMTAIARVTRDAYTAEGFYLDANELKSADTGTRLVGGRVEWAPAAGVAFGVAFFEVVRSTAPYPKAPVTIIDSARDGLQTSDVYWRYEPQAGALAGFTFSGEAAFQRNARIDMRAMGYGAEIGYRFARLPFAPRLSYSPRRYSGDDPATGRLERFDPLFYDGAPTTWSSGGNGSFVFYNSNVVVQRVRLELVFSPRDFVSVSYWDVRADKANSPIQFGQGARVAIVGNSLGLVSGFPQRDLTREFYAEYVRVISRQLFLTTGIGVAYPQDGIKAVVTNSARRWSGALVNITYRY